MEIEIPRIAMKPAELREWSVNITRYILGGAQIKDGDTIGTDANQSIRIRFSPSAYGKKETVMRLETI
jgi:hypothetical protein